MAIDVNKAVLSSLNDLHYIIKKRRVSIGRCYLPYNLDLPYKETKDFIKACFMLIMQSHKANDVICRIWMDITKRFNKGDWVVSLHSNVKLLDASLERKAAKMAEKLDIEFNTVATRTGSTVKFSLPKRSINA
jgi:hypothetical protein